MTKTVEEKNTVHEEDDWETDFRQEFISLYREPVPIDTFFVDNGKKYKVIFSHFCTMDSGLTVPALYNFDTNEDFITHNFASDLTLLSGIDTVFKKHITKASFDTLLYTLETPLSQYATLLYPVLSINNGSILVRYSISIPVTDVGVGAHIRFDTKGNHVIGQ